MPVRSRLERLEQKLPPPRPPSPESLRQVRRWKKLAGRLQELMKQADPLLTEDERALLDSFLESTEEGRRTPFDHWLFHLREGWCRLPELTPQTMKVLLLSWFAPGLNSYTSVCNQCGLEYPTLQAPPIGTWKLLPGKIPHKDPPPWYDLPAIFKSCPHCGASTYDITYTHQTRDQTLPWMELDGWMGR
jgi:hypothetical protein